MLKEIRDNFKMAMDYKWYEAMDSELVMGNWECTVSAVVGWVVQTVKMVICKWFDHDLEDHGWGGPESGGIDLVCSRCGWSYYRILY